MDARQENKLTMAKAVQLALANNSTIVNSVPAFKDTVEEFNSSINKIEITVELQEQQITGMAKDKENLRVDAIQAALEMIGAVESYAAKENNNMLYNGVHYRSSSFSRLRDNKLVAVLTKIKKLVQPHLAELKTYDVTAASLKTLAEKTNAYAKVVAAPRGLINVRSTATEELVLELKNLNAILRRMDGHARSKKSKEPTFYSTYRYARTVVNTRRRSKADAPEAVSPAGNSALPQDGTPAQAA